MTSPVATDSWIGAALARLEDERFLTGDAQFVGDLKRPGMLHAAFVRSVFAHGKLLSVDAGAAHEAPGVRAVLTGDELAPLARPFPVIAPPGADVATAAAHPVLARERVRYVGEPVALVVADTAEQAVDAAELVTVEIEELPALVDAHAAEASTLLHDSAPDNVLLRRRLGSGDVESAFAAAHTVVRNRVAAPRLIAAPLETRAVLADHDTSTDLLTLWLSAQDQHRQLAGLGAVLGRGPEQLRIIVPDVGGAFGSKGVPQAETAAVALAALRRGRPFTWAETRTESSLAVYQGRGLELDVELALDEDGRILAL
ncbi:MAG TPA: molybdopterin cofactor-binding domain-containing protein, partial [Gaiellaceae bacterium]|nr:molybdopterin cofactor-binding domain-containing protein [Gaiellaceae bacterium]